MARQRPRAVHAAAAAVLAGLSLATVADAVSRQRLEQVIDALGQQEKAALRVGSRQANAAEVTHDAVASVVSPGKVHRCGLSDPDILNEFLHEDSAIVPQRYRTLEDADALDGEMTQPRPRGLSVNNQSASFLSVREADRLNLTAPMRFTLVWDALEGGDNNGTKPRQCTFKGQQIVIDSDVGYSCTDDDIVAPGVASGSAGRLRYEVLKQRTEWAVEHWSKTLRLKPVQDSIDLNEYKSSTRDIVAEYGLSTSVLSNTDLVIIVVARPTMKPIAGSAFCLGRDTYHRCLVGVLHWVPKTFDVANRFHSEIIAAERHTGLHEVAHLLGAVIPGFHSSQFQHINETGGFQNKDDVYVIETDAASTKDHRGYDKASIKIKTPKVLQLAREQFGCETLSGVALEDVPLGAGAHWEARLLGPEFMSYGSIAGEVYISDLTLAYLEDTNQYIANYSMAGRLVAPDNKDRPDMPIEDTSDADYVPPEPLSPGYLRWGRGEGCSFVEQNAVHWSSRYICSSHKQQGCTADNRESAVCYLIRWNDVPKSFSCASPQPNGLVDCTTSNDDCSKEECDLPDMFQYFSSSTASSAFRGRAVKPSELGGYSSSLDYVPVRIGYWNCQDGEITPTSSNRSAIEGSAGGVTEGIGSKDEIDLFGGQSHCPECRCMVSSLMELTSLKVDLKFTRYGLCYRTNCYRGDYLQVGIRAAVGKKVNWYKCDTGGGKMYIPGFSGAIHCPAAEAFCRHETITGIKYEESNRWLELILWGVAIGMAVILFSLVVFPCCRDRLARCLKRRCGVLQFEFNAKLAARRSIEHKKIGTALTAINTVFTALCLAIIGLVAWWISQGRVGMQSIMPVMAASVWGLVVAVLGVSAGRRYARPTSCVLISYFFLQIFVCLVTIWTTITILAATDIRPYVEDRWDLLCDTFPDRCTPDADMATYKQEVTSMVDFLDGKMTIISALAIVFAVFNVIALGLAGRIIGCRTLTATCVTVLNNIGVVVGVLTTGVGVFLAIQLEVSANVRYVAGTFLASGVVLLANSILGLYASYNKLKTTLAVHFTVTILATLMCATAGGLAIFASERVDEKINDFDDKQLADLANAINLSASADDMKVYAKENVRRVGLAALVIAVEQIVLAISVVNFYRYTKKLFQGSFRLPRTSSKPSEQKKPQQDLSGFEYATPVGAV